MIPGQPVPTELDVAAQRAADRRATDATPAEEAAPGPRRRTRTATAAAPNAPAPLAPADPDAIGVVFIHGIGAQRAGETVLQWSAPIIRVLSAWREDHHLETDPVVRSRVDLTGRTTPFIELDIPADPTAPSDRPRQRWVLTEAWWASDVKAPGIGDMLKWLIWRGEARRIGEGILTGINAADDARDRGPVSPLEATRRRVRDAVEGVLILGLFLVLAMVAVPAYALIKLLSALPLPGIAQNLSTAQLDWFLADWFGDVRVLLSDRAQAANIRSRVETAIEGLREYGCGRIVAIGHSGGTIVGYMTLADLRPDLRVDTFITHGQALGLTWRLGHFSGPLKDFTPAEGEGEELLRRGDRLVRPLPPTIRWVDFWATHDPAPAGPLDDDVRSVSLPSRSHLVTNRNSVVNDHGGYWDNDEGFVIPVMRLIDTAGRPDGSESRFFQGYGPDDDRIVARAERVVLLSRFWLAWLVLALGTAAIGLLAGPNGFPSVGAFVLALPGSLAAPPPPGDGVWPWLIGVLAIAILSQAVSRIAAARWDEWDQESRALARHSRFVARPSGTLVGQWVVLLVAQTLVAILVAGSDARLVLLIAYAVLLLIGWFPREWRRRVLAEVPPPAD